MSRRDDQRLGDILAAAAAIADHTTRGELDDGLVFDAVRVRLIEIGEAVKAINPDLLAREPAIPWIDGLHPLDAAQTRDFYELWNATGRSRRSSPPTGSQRRW